MRDIGSRLRRYRLSRYAAPVDPIRRRLKWGWVALAAWMVWIGFVSDHSLWRIWRLSVENARAERELRRAEQSVSRLEAEMDNPQASRDLAERALRERTGMARPDEIVYRIHGGAKGDSVSR